MQFLIYLNFRSMESRQATYNDKFGFGVRVFTMKRVGMRDNHSINVMDMGKSRNTCLICHKQHQQAYSSNDSFYLFLHVPTVH